jgi:hypothetical protein
MQPAPVQPRPVQPAPIQPAPIPSYDPRLASPAPSQPAGSPIALPYRSDLPIPPGYHVESRGYSNLVTAGLVTFGIAYAGAFGVAAGNSFEEGTGWLAAPVIGPWAAMAGRKLDCKVEDLTGKKCLEELTAEFEMFVFLTADGVIQTTGVVLFLAGALGRQELLIQDGYQAARSAPADRGLKLSPPRWVARPGGGLVMLNGSF